MWWRRLAKVQTEQQNGEEDFSDFEQGMVVGARKAGLISKPLIYWDFQAQPSLVWKRPISFWPEGREGRQNHDDLKKDVSYYDLNTIAVVGCSHYLTWNLLYFLKGKYIIIQTIISNYLHDWKYFLLTTALHRKLKLNHSENEGCLTFYCMLSFILFKVLSLLMTKAEVTETLLDYNEGQCI